MRVVIPPAARRDIENALQESRELFGQRQAERYQNYFEEAARRLSLDAMHPASRNRSRLFRRVRSFHLAWAAGRKGAAAHVIYYREEVDQDGVPIILVIRVLHERMDPALHISGGGADKPTIA